MQATLIKDPCVSVKRIAWTLDGSLFGEIKEMDYNSFEITYDQNHYNLLNIFVPSSNRSCIL